MFVDIVIDVDCEVEVLIWDCFCVVCGDDGFLGEEIGVEIGVSGIMWVVDLIDGMVNYVYGILVYNVSIVVVSGEFDLVVWEVFVGVVYVLVFGEIFMVVFGYGVWFDGQCFVVMIEMLVGVFFVMGFGYDLVMYEGDFVIVVSVMLMVCDVWCIGLVVFDFVYVVVGWFDGYFEWGLWLWDFVVGLFLVMEVGGFFFCFDVDFVCLMIFVGGGVVYVQLFVIFDEKD